MQIDLEDLNPGTWFDMEGGGRVCLRVCAGDDYRAIRKQATKKKVDYPKTGGRFPYEEVDEELQAQLLWDFCIVNWENIFDKDLKPIPCTKEFKLLLMGKSVVFSRFVTEKFTELADMVSVQEEDRIKN